MDLVNFGDMVYVYTFYIGIFALVLSYRLVAKIIMRAKGSK